MKLFVKISNLCNHNTSTLRTDRQTDRTCHSNTALCVASRGKNDVAILSPWAPDYTPMPWRPAGPGSLDSLGETPSCVLGMGGDRKGKEGEGMGRGVLGREANGD